MPSLAAVAPIENSPPGIQTIPSGGRTDARRSRWCARTPCPARLAAEEGPIWRNARRLPLPPRRLPRRQQRSRRWACGSCGAQSVVAHRRREWDLVPSLFRTSESRALFAGGIRLELPHHLFNAEAGRLLARREFLEARDPLADEYLSRHEQEDTSGVPVDIVRGVVLGFLEGVAPQVEEERHSQLDEGLGPHLEALRALLLEDRLPVFVAQRHQVAVIAPVEELLARPFPALALEVRQQVVAVQVDLEGPVSHAVALPQLGSDVRIADRGEERRQHVLVGGDVVDERPRLDHPGPTDDARHPPGALPVRVLFTAERCRASVGPGEHLGAIVGSIQDD